ncbi:neuropeptide CCHamide-1 receptor-like [Daphnia pulicaria]|uniref:neuropeptide CCHamide-1 receptor-like n=1 Tax=Daphnia pulicaria TaxID=35523 RepID=UPI001EE9B67B|nr:neuropeptide CCHamide-1 receptor-like [Daphnia pulicaria]
MMFPREISNESTVATSHYQRLEQDSRELDNEQPEGYIPYNQRLEPYIVPVLFGLIFLLGVIGNGCLIVILCCQKSMRNLPNMFIFNLALGDLLVLLFTVPFTSTVYTFDSWPYGELVCKASEFAKDTSVGVSVFTLTALSFDRYTAIVQPVQSFVSGPKSKQSCIIVSLVAIWLASLGLALPAAIFSHLMKLSGEKIPEAERMWDANGTIMGPTHREILVCYPFPQEFGTVYPKIIVLGRFLIHYCLPLLIIGTFYAIMAHHLLRSIQIIPGHATVRTSSSKRQPRQPPSDTSASNNANEPALLLQLPQPNKNRKSRRKVAKMVQYFVVLFAICFLPMHVFFLWFHFDANSQNDYNNFWNAFRIFGFVLAYINSCINPIALYFISTNFRKHFNRLLFCGWARNGSISSERIRSRSERHGVNNYPLKEFREEHPPLASERMTPSACCNQQMTCHHGLGGQQHNVTHHPSVINGNTKPTGHCVYVRGQPEGSSSASQIPSRP